VKARSNGLELHSVWRKAPVQGFVQTLTRTNVKTELTISARPSSRGDSYGLSIPSIHDTALLEILRSESSWSPEPVAPYVDSSLNEPTPMDQADLIDAALLGAGMSGFWFGDLTRGKKATTDCRSSKT
jgi:hypothetical protein